MAWDEESEVASETEPSSVAASNLPLTTQSTTFNTFLDKPSRNSINVLNKKDAVSSHQQMTVDIMSAAEGSNQSTTSGTCSTTASNQISSLSEFSSDTINGQHNAPSNQPALTYLASNCSSSNLREMRDNGRLTNGGEKHNAVSYIFNESAGNLIINDFCLADLINC